MFKIRAYKKEDWLRLCDIHDRARLDELKGSVDVRAFLNLEATAKKEGLFDDQLFVGELDGQVVSFIAYSSREITWLYVDPVHYKKGFGRRLLNYALTRSGKTVEVEVLSGNKPAIQLYLSLGFKEIKRVKGKLEGNERFEAEGLTLELKK